jgi:Ca2+-binding RTX toxin-like protein
MSRTAALATAAAVAALTAAIPAAASAATVTTREFCSSPGVCNHDVLYVAAAGERNAVSVPPREGGQVILRDSGAAITPGEGCSATAPGEVRCRNAGDDPAAGHGLVSIDVGDLDDAVTASDYSVSIEGGGGDDVLTGSSGALDDLDGGPGNDVLDGGQGLEDAVIYDGHAADVRVDLARGSGGATGETDTLAGFEDVAGGFGDDRLAGTSARNALSGGPGDDRLEGRGGVDELAGDSGRDRLDGGERRDVLRGGAGGDVLRGGPGGDRLEGGAGNDRLFGGRDRNLSFGGTGNDFLDLVNGRREQGSCGSGRDRARIDRVDRARNCERVTRV